MLKSPRTSTITAATCRPLRAKQPGVRILALLVAGVWCLCEQSLPVPCRLVELARGWRNDHAVARTDTTRVARFASFEGCQSMGDLDSFGRAEERIRAGWKNT